MNSKLKITEVNNMTKPLKKRFWLIFTLAAVLLTEYLLFRPEDISLWLVFGSCVVMVASFLVPVYANTNGKYTEYFAMKNSKPLVFLLILCVIYLFVHSFSLPDKAENLLFIPSFGAFFVYTFKSIFTIAEERKKLHKEGRL